MTIRVLVADDQTLVRAGFRALLDSEDDIEVVGEAVDGADAVALAVQTRPDVVLMDIRMPRLDGLEATAQIVADPTLSGTKVLVLTTFELDEYVFGALRAGASGFLLKDVGPVALIDAVRLVADGQGLLAPAVTRRLIEAFVAASPTDGSTEQPAPATDPLPELTPREREVLTLVGRGMSNQEIAAHLVLSPLTAKTHVSRLFTKLGARDRAQLVVVGVRGRAGGLNARASALCFETRRAPFAGSGPADAPQPSRLSPVPRRLGPRGLEKCSRANSSDSRRSVSRSSREDALRVLISTTISPRNPVPATCRRKSAAPTAPRPGTRCSSFADPVPSVRWMCRSREPSRSAIAIGSSCAIAACERSMVVLA